MMLIIITVNARRISNKNKVEQIRTQINENKPDVVLVQEISMTAVKQLEGNQYKAVFN